MERYHKLRALLFQPVPVTAVCAAHVCLSRKRSICPTRILPYERFFVSFSRHTRSTLRWRGFHSEEQREGSQETRFVGVHLISLRSYREHTSLARKLNPALQTSKTAFLHIAILDSHSSSSAGVERSFLRTPEMRFLLMRRSRLAAVGRVGLRGILTR